MDTPALVDRPDFDEGRKAFDAIKGASIPVDLAFWAYFSDSSEWRFVAVTSWLERRGPNETYTAIRRALRQKDVKLPLRLVTVARPDEPLARVGLNAAKVVHPFGTGQDWTVSTLNVTVNTKYIYR